MKIIESPSEEPILTLPEVKLFCRVEHNDEDGLFSDLILAATQACETYINRVLFSARVQVFLDKIPKDMIVPLPKGYISEIEYVKVHTENGEDITLSDSDYLASINATEGFSSIAFLFPIAFIPRKIDGIEITYTAGYSTVPGPLKLGMKQCIAHWYENREQIGAVPKGSKKLWAPYRIFAGGK